MSVTGLKSFESSYSALKSPTRSDNKFCWMFCLVLRNSLTIKCLFLGSVIIRNDMFFISYLFLFFEHGFERCFEHGLEHIFEHGFVHSFEHCFEHGFEHGFEHDFEHGFERGFEHGFEHGYEHGFKL